MTGSDIRRFYDRGGSVNCDDFSARLKAAIGRWMDGRQ